MCALTRCVYDSGVVCTIIFLERSHAKFESAAREKRLEYAKEVIRDYSDKIPPRFQEAILAQRVILGIRPMKRHSLRAPHFMSLQTQRNGRRTSTRTRSSKRNRSTPTKAKSG